MNSLPANGLRARLFKQLSNFNLDVEITCGQEEILALVGPSGSGKTTVLRCLAGLETPDQGEVCFGGDIWSRGNKLHRTPQHRRVGLLSQDALLFPHMTLRENVEFAMPMQEDPGPLFEQMGIRHLVDRKPYQVSGGERQRAALCQVLASSPCMLLLDEPFSALDVENRFMLRELILNLRRTHHLPILHVTHDLADGLNMADRVVSLRDGRHDPDWLKRQTTLLRQQAAGLSLATAGCQETPQAYVRHSA
ncbi:ATP-binding cassette domain-containing protein [Desulfovibrio inopinatus]|uniref:ATP-binding cassette domain-containing protein n=1 Tax=Desulfovibrio inopinatus TaxID=102109 RepID=UPI0004253FEE|nr:ATP-binding cassette domain-containing protein [Desulfovibrio inopinatus]